MHFAEKLFCLSYNGIEHLRRAVRRNPQFSNAPVLAAIQRLEDGEGKASDVELLRPLAKVADLPWNELWLACPHN